MKTETNLTLTSDAPGQRLFMLGNEAIARGAVEAGIGLLAAYPGTPSSEIAESLVNASKDLNNVYVEWSVNEKVAFEVAFAASMCGIRAITTMKHVGLNVAHDPLMTAGYMGTKGGLVVVVADDPFSWSSQNEQDSRYVAMQGYFPVLEPSSGQEAKDMMAEAFQLSEEFGQPFILRSVTRLSHARASVTLGSINKEQRKGKFEKDSTRWVTLPVNARNNRKKMLARMANIKKAVNAWPYNKLELVPGSKVGIIATGLGYAYSQEALHWLDLAGKVSILKIGTSYPIPDELTREFLSSVNEAVVIEESEPIIENQVKVLAQESKINTLVRGKDIIPLVGELSTRNVMEPLAQFLKVGLPIDFGPLDRLGKEVEPLLTLRPPTICPGCPHRASLYSEGQAVKLYKKEFGVEAVRVGDIGCYSSGFYPPLNADDITICMGASFGAANGLAHVNNVPTIAHIGDSTFFHSGIPPLVNAVFNHAKVTFLILDNATTGQTGFQEDPATGSNARGEATTAIKPEDIARACQVKFIETVDPYNVKATIEAIERALRFDGPSVVVCRHNCLVLEQRAMRKKGLKYIPWEIDLSTCSNCKLCVKSLGCPAILIENDQVVIDASQCNGCGVCAQICPTKSVHRKEGK